MKELLKLANDDYQKRGNKYPKADIPDSIAVSLKDENATIEFDFKNTDDSSALEWYEKSKESNTIQKYKKEYDIQVVAKQDGDYKDDWQKLTVLLTKKDAIKSATNTKDKPITTNTQPSSTHPSTPKKTQTSKSDDKCYTYTYILSTTEQRNKINLSQYKVKLEKICKEFFGPQLKNMQIEKQSYTLVLKEEFTTGDKRRLGRLISQNSGLKQYVNTIIYNGNKDASGQLFRLKKPSEVTHEKV